MNQTPRIIIVSCIKCKKNNAQAKEVYDRNVSDYIMVSTPICEECRKKMDKEKYDFIMQRFMRKE